MSVWGRGQEEASWQMQPIASDEQRKASGGFLRNADALCPLDNAAIDPIKCNQRVPF